MNAQSILLTLTFVVLALLIWQLRWVLLVLFGAVVVAVALDVLIHQLQNRSRLARPQALLAVLAGLLLAGLLIGQLLLPELITQTQQLGQDHPELVNNLSGLGDDPRFSALNQTLSSGASPESLQSVGRQLLGVAGGANSLIQVLLMALLAILLALTPSSGAWLSPSRRVQRGTR